MKERQLKTQKIAFVTSANVVSMSKVRAPAPPDPSKRRLTGDLTSLDHKSGKGLIASDAGEFSFNLSASLTVSDRKQLLNWTVGGPKMTVEFSVLATDDGKDEVCEVLVSKDELISTPEGASLTAIQTTSIPGVSSTTSILLADQEDTKYFEVDRVLLSRDDCDDPSLARHPPMFQIFWEMDEFVKSTKNSRTVPVIMVRSRITVSTALLAIINEKQAIGCDVVSLEDGLILLCVCTGAAVFVFDLPKMHVPERDAVAMWLLSMSALRPQIPLVSLSVSNMLKLAKIYPESFIACKSVGIVDVIQAAQQVLPQIAHKARSAEELINMVFGYKHAPRPTKSEDAAMSIAFGRPAFHSRQVFSQLNNLARNSSFAQLLDQTASSKESATTDDSSPASSSHTANAYKRRRLGSNHSIDSNISVYTSRSNSQEFLDDAELNADQFMEWIKNEMKKDHIY
jgi:hypothetical protein